MERRRLGRTEHRSSVAILGGAAFWKGDRGEAEAALRLADERGVNHLDIAPQYGDAEVAIGPFLPAVRDGWFVAGKTLRKNPAGVRAQLEETLRRLGTDHLDLYQLHAVTSRAELETRIDAAGAILTARDEGLVRHVGITGHDFGAPGAFVEALDRWDLDTVMFPVYATMWADPVYRADAERLLGICGERDVGVMAIKAVARRLWPTAEQWATSWYEPHRDPEAIQRGVDFALSVDGVHAFCTPGDVGLLPSVLDAAARHHRLDPTARADALAAVAAEAPIFPMP
ncbi:MAG: aldo/keto reductase [Acidimicrobiales bacterium]